MKVGILGGGAAGFFAGLELAKDPRLDVHLFERTSHLLSKVKISGGGRCNVTHNLFDPQKFSEHYPRGSKELAHAFKKFQANDMVSWLSEQNVKLKAEKDGRMFPVTDSSETIIRLFLDLAKKRNLKIHTKVNLKGIRKDNESLFSLVVENDTRDSSSNKAYYPTGHYSEFSNLVIATGSSRQVWKWMEAMGHRIVSPVPSLFTLKINDPRLDALSGISFPRTKITYNSSSSKKITTQGPLLFTHWGMSGPAILRLSAWGARELYEEDYKATIEIQFLSLSYKEVLECLEKIKITHAKKNISWSPWGEEIPQRYWERLLEYLNIPGDKKWSMSSKDEAKSMAKEMAEGKFSVEGKGEFKDEFVTAGGIHRKDVNFETMESRVVPGIFFAGEVLDVDGITGGFNFQNAWTTAWIASSTILQKLP